MLFAGLMLQVFAQENEDNPVLNSEIGKIQTVETFGEIKQYEHDRMT